MSASSSLARFGLAVGHATDSDGATGCTVIRGVEHPLRAAVHVMGRATGSRELALLEPGHSVERVDAILLTGGSAYGLDAAAGVMQWMESKGRGYPVGAGVVPIVPAAVIFDLLPLGRFDARPTAQMAFAACDSAISDGVAEGCVGVGTGATVGKGSGPVGAMKGGFALSVVSGGDSAVAALVVVNALGDVRDGSGRIIAGARDGKGAFVDTARRLAEGGARKGFINGTATTLVVLACDAAFSRLELQSLARSATAALQRRITPVGTQSDGDIIFALAPMDGPKGSLPQAEQLAITALEQAVERAVRLAVGRDGVPGLADRA